LIIEMKIKYLYLLLLPIFLISCATSSKEHNVRVMPNDDMAMYTAMSYFNYSELERQDGNIDKAYQAMLRAYKAYPESVYLKEKLLMYLSANALRDSATAAYVMKLGEEWYEAGSYNSRIMFILGEVCIYSKEIETADKYFQASLNDEPDKQYYMTYYMFKKLYAPPADTLYLEKAIEKPWQEDDKQTVYRVADIYKEAHNDKRAAELLYDAYLRWNEANILLNLVALNQYQGELDEGVETILQDLLAKDELSEQLAEYLLNEYYTHQEFDKVVAMQKQCRGMGNEYALKLLYISALEVEDFELAIEIGNLLLLLEEMLPEQHFLILGKLWELEFLRGNFDEAIRYLVDINDIQQQFLIIKMVSQELDAEEEVLAFMEYYYQNARDKDGALFLLILLNREEGKIERVPELLSLLDPEYLVEWDLSPLLALPFLEETTQLSEEDIELYKPFLERNLVLAGFFYFYCGDEDEALTYMRRAYKQGEHNLQMVLMYGNILEQRSEDEELLELLKDAINKYPQQSEVLNFYGYMAAEKEWEQEYANAESSLNTALEMEPDNAMYWDSLGWLYYRMQRPADALSAMQKAEEAANVNGDIALHYGIILALNGEKEKAGKFLTLVEKLTDNKILIGIAQKHLADLEYDNQEE